MYITSEKYKRLSLNHGDEYKGQPKCAGWKQKEGVSLDMLQLEMPG
jgi:hypothetical protein